MTHVCIKRKKTFIFSGKVLHLCGEFLFCFSPQLAQSIIYSNQRKKRKGGSEGVKNEGRKEGETEGDNEGRKERENCNDQISCINTRTLDLA